MRNAVAGDARAANPAAQESARARWDAAAPGRIEPALPHRERGGTRGPAQAGLCIPRLERTAPASSPPGQRPGERRALARPVAGLRIERSWAGLAVPLALETSTLCLPECSPNAAGLGLSLMVSLSAKRTDSDMPVGVSMRVGLPAGRLLKESTTPLARLSLRPVVSWAGRIMYPSASISDFLASAWPAVSGSSALADRTAPPCRRRF